MPACTPVCCVSALFSRWHVPRCDVVWHTGRPRVRHDHAHRGRAGRGRPDAQAPRKDERVAGKAARHTRVALRVSREGTFWGGVLVPPPPPPPMPSVCLAPPPPHGSPVAHPRLRGGDDDLASSAAGGQGLHPSDEAVDGRYRHAALQGWRAVHRSCARDGARRARAARVGDQAAERPQPRHHLVRGDLN